LWTTALAAAVLTAAVSAAAVLTAAVLMLWRSQLTYKVNINASFKSTVSNVTITHTHTHTHTHSHTHTQFGFVCAYLDGTFYFDHHSFSLFSLLFFSLCTVT
jgi:hypothetical protein